MSVHDHRAPHRALCMFLFVGLLMIAVHSQAQEALAKCEESDAEACAVAVKSNLPPKQLSEAYTFWADTFPNQYGNTAEPMKLLRKALELDPDNAMATYLIAMYIPGGMNFRYDEEKEKLLKRAIQLRPDWEAPHVQLALLAEPWGYQKMIEEWTIALKFGPDDPFYAAKLKEAREKFEAQKRDFAETEAKAKVDLKLWAIATAISAKSMCDVAKSEEWIAKYHEFHRGGQYPVLVLADTYAACGQPEKARAMYREIIANYKKRVNTILTIDDAIQVPDKQLWYLDLLPESNQMHIIRGILYERDNEWWRVKLECEEAERGVPTSETYAQHANALIKGEFPGYQMELQTVIEKALKLDPRFLDEHPEYRSRYKEAAQQ